MKFALKLIACAAAATCLSSAWASDGTVTVNGTVSATTCTIVGNGSSGTGSFTVTLPSVSTGSLAAAGATAGATPFTIGVSGCSGGTSTTMTPYFESGANINSSGRLSNTAASSPATGVDVQLTTGSGAVITMNAAPGSQGVSATTLSSGAGTSSFIARYYATAAATAGAYASSFTYSIQYN